jgi:hypothetical protein
MTRGVTVRNKLLWGVLFALPLIVGGGPAHGKVRRTTLDQPRASAFVCPITGEELPCPNCCPLNTKR